MQLQFGKQEFNFIPRTFILPQDTKLLRRAWEGVGSKQKWIVKPVGSLGTIFNTSTSETLTLGFKCLVFMKSF